jgi:hypothetical protein
MSAYSISSTLSEIQALFFRAAVIGALLEAKAPSEAARYIGENLDVQMEADPNSFDPLHLLLAADLVAADAVQFSGELMLACMLGVEHDGVDFKQFANEEGRPNDLALATYVTETYNANGGFKINDDLISSVNTLINSDQQESKEYVQKIRDKNAGVFQAWSVD